jgi:hypothetical protein
MRAQNQQDLIYKRGQAGITKASVTIVFDNSDRETSPVGLENCKQITVTRQVCWCAYLEGREPSLKILIDCPPQCLEIPSQWPQVPTTDGSDTLPERPA